jgi:dihydroxyacetone synthase
MTALEPGKMAQPINQSSSQHFTAPCPIFCTYDHAIPKRPLKANRSSTIISTSRQNLPQYSESRRDAVKYGAYVFREKPDASVTILGVGAEMCFAVETADELSKAGISTRIVSFPSHRLFEQQSREYRRATLRPKDTAVVVVEAYAANGWERYAHASISMKTFGKSLPGKVAYSYFGFN